MMLHLSDKNRHEYISKNHGICGTIHCTAGIFQVSDSTRCPRFERWSVVQLELGDCNTRPTVGLVVDETTFRRCRRLIWPMPKDNDSRAKILR